MIKSIKMLKGNRFYILILFCLIPIIGLLSLLGYYKLYDESMSIENLQVTNITESAFTVTWTSEEAYIGNIVIRTAEDDWGQVFSIYDVSTFLDDRDSYFNNDGEYVETEGGQIERFTHHVTVFGLEPESEYEFRMAGKLNAVAPENNKVKTIAINDDLSTPEPGYGFIKNINPQDSYVVLYDSSEDIKYSVTVSDRSTYSIDVNHYMPILNKINNLSLDIFSEGDIEATHNFKNKLYQLFEDITVNVGEVSQGREDVMIIKTEAAGHTSPSGFDNPNNTTSSPPQKKQEKIQKRADWICGGVTGKKIGYCDNPNETVAECEACIEAKYANYHSPNQGGASPPPQAPAPPAGNVDVPIRGEWGYGKPKPNSMNEFNFSIRVSAEQEGEDEEGEEEGMVVDESGNYLFFQEGEVIAESTVVVGEDGTVTIKLFYDDNNNGIKDEDEEYYEDYTTVNISQDEDAQNYSLNYGWNLITIPIIDTSEEEPVLTASDLIDYWNEQGTDIVHVARFKGGQFQMYSQREGEADFSNDFNLVPGEAYFVLNYIAENVVFEGNRIESAVKVPISNGWNMIGIISPDNEYNSEQVLDEFAAEGLTADTITTHESGLYTSIVKEADVVYGNNFNIVDHKGYFVRVVEGGGEDASFTP